MIVSHSNMKQYQKCRRSFYYAVKLNLSPNDLPDPMKQGLYGHDLMEEGFRELLNGRSEMDAINAVNQLVEQKLAADPNTVHFMKVVKNVIAFIGHFCSQPWEVVYIEANDNWPVTDDASFGYTPDLVCRWTEGTKKGQLFVLDYKFTGQYWNERQVNLATQMLKYAIYLNKKLGLQGSAKIRHAGIVMLNTRSAQSSGANALFLLKWCPVSREKMETIEKENEAWVKEIEPFMRMTPEEFLPLALRTPDEYTCKGCWYAEICHLEFNGHDSKNTIKADFHQNDYGYN